MFLPPDLPDDQPADLSPYTPDERAIFGPYWDGAGQVYADPLAVYRTLVLELEGDPNEALDQASGGPVDAPETVPEAVKLEAEARVAAAGRKAFQMAPFDRATGQGATDDEVLKVVREFCEWTQRIKVPAGI